MKIGYARVSTIDQNLDLQVPSLKPPAVIRFTKKRHLEFERSLIAERTKAGLKRRVPEAAREVTGKSCPASR